MLGVRLDPDVEQSLAALAKRTRRSKSEIVRELVTRHLRAQDEVYLAEARRMSRRAAETDPPEILDLLDRAMIEISQRYPE